MWESGWTDGWIDLSVIKLFYLVHYIIYFKLLQLVKYKHWVRDGVVRDWTSRLWFEWRWSHDLLSASLLVDLLSRSFQQGPARDTFLL